jgi:hypothetical protein
VTERVGPGPFAKGSTAPSGSLRSIGVDTYPEPVDTPRDTAERRTEAGPENTRLSATHDSQFHPRSHQPSPPGEPARRERPVPPPPPAPAPPPAAEAPPTRRARRARDDGQDDREKHHGVDRFAWRRRIRADPHRYRIYRVCVALVGSLMMAMSVLLGWLPGPGGIPLFLLGLAVLASEFHWARRALDRTRAFAHRVHMWSDRQPVWVRWLSGIATVLTLLALAWLGLRLVGGSDALPQPMGALLRGVPGLD